MFQQLTILGDRLAGKSYTLDTLAIDAAGQGERVLYECENQQMAAERFRQCLERVERLGILSRAVHTCGNKRIYVTAKPEAEPGRILFQSPRSGSRVSVDTHLMDNVLSEPNITARRVIRTVLR
jgi:hypothetical protein